MAYSIFEIADWFLAKESMTPKKLQKLTYYAEAWSHALLNRSIVDDTHFEAWAHGPVSDKLYQKYREYKWSDIEKNENEVSIDDEKDLELLESVWFTYGDMTANALEAQTHSESPWRNARIKGNAEPGERSNEVISNEDMRIYYQSIYAGDE
ncbi:Panacea domain-containing protein [Lactococcus formosensis]|uniref:Panacea domain-containing protein n=1 Tax=Lactococcus formosensis TaxID=1281486 RepID=UPI0032643B9A